MLYVSTRGKTDLFSAAHAITRGLAADGGLFVPQNIPAMRMVDIKAMERKPYTERAVDVLLQYLTDFSEDELRECVNAAYAPEKFGDNPVPLVQVNDNTGVLELWHGPTSAFKDMALQLLPHLLTRCKRPVKRIRLLFWLLPPVILARLLWKALLMFRVRRLSFSTPARV